MYSISNDPYGPGFPIRTSSDHSSFTNSPRLFAGIHVLHRLFPPRHPPYALIHLTIYPAIPCRIATKSQNLATGLPFFCCKRTILRTFRYAVHKRQSISSPLPTLLLFLYPSLLLPTPLGIDLPTSNLVELTGIEPVTPCLQSRCSPS